MHLLCLFARFEFWFVYLIVFDSAHLLEHSFQWWPSFKLLDYSNKPWVFAKHVSLPISDDDNERLSKSHGKPNKLCMNRKQQQGVVGDNTRDTVVGGCWMCGSV